MRVKVMQKHIREGRKQSTSTCAVALAIKERFKANDVMVANMATIDGINYELPEKVHKFIDRFDEGKSVKPF
jgi:hypothetical protein